MEGVAIYTTLRALPLDLTTHNIGNVDSIGNIIFLAGARRYASIWSGHVGPPPYTGYRVQGIQSMCGGWVVGLAGGQNRCAGMLPARCCGMIGAAVLGGELAVPCTRNPLQRD